MEYATTTAHTHKNTKWFFINYFNVDLCSLANFLLRVANKICTMKLYSTSTINAHKIDRNGKAL